MDEISTMVAQLLDRGEWRMVTDERTGRPYYYQASTRRTVWDLRKLVEMELRKSRYDKTIVASANGGVLLSRAHSGNAVEGQKKQSVADITQHISTSSNSKATADRHRALKRLFSNANDVWAFHENNLVSIAHRFDLASASASFCSEKYVYPVVTVSDDYRGSGLCYISETTCECKSLDKKVTYWQEVHTASHPLVLCVCLHSHIIAVFRNYVCKAAFRIFGVGSHIPDGTFCEDESRITMSIHDEIDAPIRVVDDLLEYIGLTFSTEDPPITVEGTDLENEFVVHNSSLDSHAVLSAMLPSPPPRIAAKPIARKQLPQHHDAYAAALEQAFGAALRITLAHPPNTKTRHTELPKSAKQQPKKRRSSTKQQSLMEQDILEALEREKNLLSEDELLKYLELKNAALDSSIATFHNKGK